MLSHFAGRYVENTAWVVEFAYASRFADTLRACAILLVIGRHAWEILKWPSLKTFFGLSTSTSPQAGQCLASSLKSYTSAI